MSVDQITWNLGDLYDSPSSPMLEADANEADRAAGELARKYRGGIAKLSASGMRDLLAEYEAILERGQKPGEYAQLSWVTQSDDPARGALLQKHSERLSRLAQALVFLELEWAHVPDDAARKLIDDPLLARWRHWLVTTRRYKPYLLTESEEKILREKAVTGAQAWTRFFDETQTATFYECNGERVPREVVLNKLHQQDREVRRQAAVSITKGLKGIERASTFIFNTLLADKFSDDTLRRYPSWITQRNMDNQVDDATVEALVGAVSSRYGIVARYYTLKKKLLGLDELFDYDRYAPLPASQRKFSWDEARATVLEAYARFHPRMAEIASLFFEGRWIDAEVKPGKLGGAFSSSTVPSAHPYILMSFQGTAEDVMTLAHELGHGVHQYLARDRGILLQNTPLTMAETASVFGESLVFQDLISKEADPSVVLAMLVREIESSFATVFRQVAMNRFEHSIHTARRSSGELDSRALAGLWLDTQRAMFGDSVTLTEDYSLWWSYIPHFLHVPGYVYAYAFGDLLVRALYARYVAGAEGFPEKYLAMLAAGGSDWPHALVKPLGVNLADPGFWHNGLNLLESMVARAEGLAAKATR
jgi:oligoendopeptidase F